MPCVIGVRACMVCVRAWCVCVHGVCACMVCGAWCVWGDGVCGGIIDNSLIIPGTKKGNNFTYVVRLI